MARFISKPSESIANGLVWAALGSCLPLLIFYEVYLLFLAEVSQPATRIMPFFWLIYSGLAFFLVSFVSWCLNRLLSLIVFSGWTIFSVWSLKLAFMPQFFGLDEKFRLGLVLLLLVVVFLVVERLSRDGPWVPLRLGFIALIIFIAVPQLRYSAIITSGEKFGLSNDHQLRTENDSPSPQNFSVFSDIQLKTKPNLYILLYDSLIPPEVADIFFGLRSAGYATELSNLFIRPRGVTAQNSVPSKPSMREIMWLGAPPEGGSYDYFNGVQDSPLANLFRSNGYAVTTGYTTTYWGEAGDFISDHLYLSPAPLQLQETTLCIDSGLSFASRLRSFGICAVLGPFDSTPSLKRIARLLVADEKYFNTNASWRRAVDNQIRSNASSDAPQLTFLYTYTPVGHTKLDYDHAVVSDRSEYVSHFKRLSGLAGLVIRDLFETVQTVDKNAIVIVAGDHGTYISRKSVDSSFLTVDRQLVALGLMRTENQCVEWHENNGFVPNPLGYHTVSSVLISILSCLAEDDTLAARLPFPPSHRIPYELLQVPRAIDLEKFVREHISDELLTTLPSGYQVEEGY